MDALRESETAIILTPHKRRKFLGFFISLSRAERSGARAPRMGYFFPALEIFATLNVREDKGMEISPIRKCFDEEEFVESVKNWAKATVERGVAVNCKAADRPRLPKGFVRLSRLATCHV